MPSLTTSSDIGAFLAAADKTAAKAELEIQWSEIGSVPAFGNAALATTSTGGNGAADSGKVAVYGSTGELATSGAFAVKVNGFVSAFVFGAMANSYAWTSPEASGTLALTTNTSGIPDNLVTSSTKTTPIDADSVLMTDSEAAGTPAKRTTFANLWTWIKSKIEATALTLAGLTVTNYTESVVSIGTVTTSHTLALTNGTRQRVRLTASTACTFTMPTATDGKSFVLEVEQAATTGAGTAAFTGVDFGAAGAPTITPTAGKMDIITFMANGSKWYGSYVQGYTY